MQISCNGCWKQFNQSGFIIFCTVIDNANQRHVYLLDSPKKLYPGAKHVSPNKINSNKRTKIVELESVLITFYLTNIKKRELQMYSNRIITLYFINIKKHEVIVQAKVSSHCTSNSKQPRFLYQAVFLSHLALLTIKYTYYF